MISNNIALFTTPPSEYLTNFEPEAETLFTLPEPDPVDTLRTDPQGENMLSLQDQVELATEESEAKALLNIATPLAPFNESSHHSVEPLQVLENGLISTEQSRLSAAVPTELTSGNINDLETQLIAKGYPADQIDNNNVPPKPSSIKGLEDVFNEAKTDKQIDIPTNYSIQSSRLNINLKEHFSNNSSFAGSSDKLIQAAPEFSNVDFSMSSFVEQYQREGKMLPPGGNNLPGNLPFLSSSIEKTLPADTVTDLMSKPVNVSTLANTDILSNTQNSALLKTASNTSFVIESPAGSPGWNTQLGNKIRWMGSVNISSAELKLHPAELGALQIIISTEDEHTTVNFFTSNSAAKEVIEASIPRLRDLLSSSGLQLEQSDVSQQNLSQDGSSQEKMNNNNMLHEKESLISGSASLEAKQHSNRQIDHYV